MGTPAFVRNLNDEDNTIIRVAETPADYISIHGVEYLEDRAEDEDDNEWSTLQEKFLEKDTETIFHWTGFSSVSCQGDNSSFPEAVAYRVDGDDAEYTKAEILSLINSWEPSFSGYTYWDGHNWSFQHTADELGNWVGVDAEAESLGDGIYYVVVRSQRNANSPVEETVDFYVGDEDELTPTDAATLVGNAPYQSRDLENWVMGAIETRLRYADAELVYAEKSAKNPFGCETLATNVEHLNDLRRLRGKKATTAEKLAAKRQKNGTLM